MNISEVIQGLRILRSGPDRVNATELIHKLERYSLGTEVVLPVKADFKSLSKSYDVNLEMKNEKLYITAAK